MSLVIHYWIGDVQDSQGVSASEMTYIVSGWALIYSLAHLAQIFWHYASFEYERKSYQTISGLRFDMQQWIEDSKSIIAFD